MRLRDLKYSYPWNGFYVKNNIIEFFNLPVIINSTLSNLHAVMHKIDANNGSDKSYHPDIDEQLLHD